MLTDALKTTGTAFAQALRRLRKSPGFVAAVVASLALGVGLNAAVFSVIETAMFGQLPYHNPDQLYSVQDPRRTGEGHFLTYREYETVRAESRSFDGVAAFRAGFASRRQLHLDSRSGQAGGYAVSASLFHVLGVNPIRGRALTASDESSSSAPVAVVGYKLWKNQFDGRDDAIGSAVRIAGTTYTIAGVMPSGFWFPWIDGEFWVPLRFGSVAGDADERSLSFVGRLKPSVTADQAASEVTLLGSRLDRAAAGSGIRRWWRLTSLDDARHASDANFFYVLQAVVACVLLVACANVSNLMLIRAAKRRRETAIRAALGAASWQVMQPVIAEGLLIVLAAVPAGAFLAYAAMRIAAAMSSSPVTQQILRVNMNLRLLAFLAAAAVVLIAACIIAPALQAHRANPNDILKNDSSTGGMAVRLQRWKGISITFQFALSLMLLINTAILIRGVVNSSRWRPGIDAKHIYALHLRPAGADAGPGDQLLARVIERVRVMPGVLSVAAVDRCPPQLSSITDDAGRQIPAVDCRVVTRDYVKTMGIPVSAGRAFMDADVGASNAAIVEEGLATRLWGNAGATGRTLRLGDEGAMQSMTVVGVTKHVEIQPPSNNAFRTTSTILRVGTLDSAASPTLLIRVAASGVSMPAIRSAILKIDPDQPVTTLRSMDAVFADRLAPLNWYASMLGLFSLLALLLAAVGLNGVVNYLAIQRTREIGIRIALGATRRQIATLVMQGTMWYVGVGIVIGALGALALTTVVASLLNGIGVNGLTIPLIATLALSGIAAVGSMIPALRIASLNPAIALRSD